MSKGAGMASMAGFVVASLLLVTGYVAADLPRNPADRVEAFDLRAEAARIVQAFETFIKDMEAAEVLEQLPRKREKLEGQFKMRLKTAIGQASRVAASATEEQRKHFQRQYYGDLVNMLDAHHQLLRHRISAEQDPLKRGSLQTWERYWAKWLQQFASALQEVDGGPRSTRRSATAPSANALGEQGSAERQAAELSDLKIVLQKLTELSGMSGQAPGGELLRQIAVVQARAGEIYNAFHTAVAIGSVKDRLWAYSKIAEVRAVAGDMRSANEALNRMGRDELAVKMQSMTGSLGMQAKVSALQTIAVAQAKSGNIREAEETLARIEFSSLHPSIAEEIQAAVLREFALSHVQRGQVDAALKSVGAIKNSSRRVQALADVAVALAEAGQKDGVHRAIEALSQNKPGPLMVSRIVGALVKAGDLHAARQYLQAEWQKPYAATDGMARRYLVEAHAIVDPAIAVQKAMTLSEKPQASRASDRVLALAAIARTQARASDFKGALATVLMIQDAKQKDATLDLIAQGLIEAGDLSHALEAARMIQHSMWKPILARTLALTGDESGAKQLTASLSGSFERSQALAAIVKAQIATKQLDGAVRTAAGIQEDNIKLPMYRELALAQVQAGQTAAALQSILQIPFQWRPEALRQAAYAQALMGDDKGAELWVDDRQIPFGVGWALLGTAEGMLDRAQKSSMAQVKP